MVSHVSKALEDIVKRAEAWPREAQEELVRVAHEIEDEYMDSQNLPDDESRARARRRAWARLDQLFARMRALNTNAPQSPEEIREEEERIAEEVQLMRRQKRHA
jgi:hypothetical protein